MAFIEKNQVVGAFQCNCRLIVCCETGEALMIDPGDEASVLLKLLGTVQATLSIPIRLRFLLHTHGHLDHVGATREIKQQNEQTLSAFSPQIALHKGDEPLYLQLQKQGAHFGFHYDEPLPVDHFLEDEEVLWIGKLRFSILHTPGHSPGSVCIRWHEDSSQGVLSESLFSGDTLFRGSVGRTDLWGAHPEQLFKSIHERILTLDDHTRVCPGHGPQTTVKHERQTNPFLR